MWLKDVQRFAPSCFKPLAGRQRFTKENGATGEAVMSGQRSRARPGRRAAGEIEFAAARCPPPPPPPELRALWRAREAIEL